MTITTHYIIFHKELVSIKNVLHQYQQAENILQHYIANDNTLAILPTKQIDYHSLVIEKSQVYHIRKTPLEIIKASCEHNWSTYEGRKATVTKHMGFTYKVPIIIKKTTPL